MADRNRGRWTFLGLAGLALVNFVAAIGLASEPRQTHVIGSGGSVHLCISPSDPAIADLRSGNRRAVLVVHEREGGGSLRVSLPPLGVETRIGFFPDDDFNVTSGDEARRFLLPSAEGAEADDICFEIRLEGAPDGRVEISLDIAQPTKQ